MNARQMLGLAIGIITFSCAASEKESESSLESFNIDHAVATAEKRRKAGKDEAGVNTKLLAFQHRYDELLTKEMVITATGFDERLLTVKYSKVMSNPEQHNIIYKFDNKRSRVVFGSEMVLPYPDEIILKSIQKISAAQFEERYRTLTVTERQHMDEVVEELVSVPNGQPGVKEKKLGAAAAGALSKTFQKVTEGYRAIEGLGDAAVWNVYTNELAVLDNGVQFGLLVDVKPLETENKEIAMGLARILLDKLKN